MKKALQISGVVIGAGLIVLLFLANHYRAEQYQIVYAVFLAATNQDVLREPAALCYSNEQLEQALKPLEALGQVRVEPFNLDHTNLIACVIPNHTVERVVGHEDTGFIIARKSPTSGISFTVFKGTKRFLQFNYPDSFRDAR